jgi:hypothetical protein
MELTEKQENALLRALRGQSELWVHPGVYPQLPAELQIIAKKSEYLEVNTMIVFDRRWCDGMHGLRDGSQRSVGRN